MELDSSPLAVHAAKRDKQGKKFRKMRGRRKASRPGLFHPSQVHAGFANTCKHPDAIMIDPCLFGISLGPFLSECGLWTSYGKPRYEGMMRQASGVCPPVQAGMMRIRWRRARSQRLALAKSLNYLTSAGWPRETTIVCSVVRLETAACWLFESV